MKQRFIAVQNQSGPVSIGTSAEYVEMSDGTFLSDNLGDLDVMHNGNVADRLEKLTNQNYAPISNPQFLNSMSVSSNASNPGYSISFGVAQTDDGWQTKVNDEIFINGRAIIKNESNSKGITITPPTSSAAKSILVADNGIQVKVGSDSILNINNNNLEVLKDIALKTNNLTTTGEIIANNLAYSISIDSQAELFDAIDKYANLNQPIFIKLSPRMAYVLLTGKKPSTTQSASGYGYCLCSIRQNDSGTTDHIATIFFKRGKTLCESTVTIRSRNTPTLSINTFNIAIESETARFSTVSGGPFNW